MPIHTRCILTNPPYKYTTEFILHALELLPEGGLLCLLLNLNYLAGKTRYEAIYSKFPPMNIYVFTGRIQCAKNGYFEKSNVGCINYAWFVWKKGNIFSTQIDWIDTNK